MRTGTLPSGASAGIGFAIPASVAKPITDQLMRNGAVARGYVGLALNTFNPERWEALGQPRDFKGAYIDSVTPGGPADDAGVEPGDLLVGVNGRPVANGTEATRAVSSSRPGDTIRLEVIRDGRRRVLNVRSGTRPAESDLRESVEGGAPGLPSVPSAPQGQVVEGATLTPLSDALRSRYNVPESTSGVIVTAVERGSAAAEAGLQPGVVISRAGSRVIGSAADLSAAVREVKAAGRPSILLFVSAGPQRGTLVLKFETE